MRTFLDIEIASYVCVFYLYLILHVPLIFARVWQSDFHTLYVVLLQFSLLYLFFQLMLYRCYVVRVVFLAVA